MTEKIEVATHNGPILVRVLASEPVKARTLSTPVRMRILGIPGPPGPRGEPGASGSLQDGITIDGGNF
jgi:hypothetical protein